MSQAIGDATGATGAVNMGGEGPAGRAWMGVRVVRADEGSQATAQTAGFVRRELVAAPGAWLGVTRTPAGSASGWHHHNAYDTYIYLLEGSGRLDFGPGGGQSVEASAGDLVVIPRGVVHREVNTGEGENAGLIVRVGAGEPVANVDGPDPA